MGDTAHVFQFRHIFNCFDEKNLNTLPSTKTMVWMQLSQSNSLLPLK